MVEKIAEAAFVVVVVVETYPSFAVALRPIAVVVAAAALAVVRALSLPELLFLLFSLLLLYF